MLSGEIEGYSLDKRLIRPDCSIVWVYLVVAPLTLSHRQRFNHICLIQDITRRKAVEQALSESVRSESVLLSHLPGMAYRCQYDRDWTMEYVSEGCLELTGYPTSSLIGNRDLSFNDLIAPEYREILWEKWKQVLAERKPFKDEYEIVTRAGVRKWVIEMGQGLFDSRGRIEALEGIILDISDRKEMEHALKYSNEHDAWTGLYNRRYLEMLLGRDERKPEPLKRALVGINLGSLQTLNRVYGFHYTWDLIKRVSDTLAGFCSEGRQLFSMYEHHFAFYLKGYGDRKDLNGFCSAVATALRQLLTVERIDIGIGVIEIDEQNSLSAEQFFKSLLIASEKALEFYDDDKVCFFDRDMEKAILREEEIKRELALAADGKADERLVLQYQPILDLMTDGVCGFEALARFDSRGFGRISPLEFIPIAEETKLIVPLGYQIIRKALQFLQTLQSNGYSNLHISINISAIQLLRGDFLPALERIVRDTGVSPECINLEITESILAVNYQEINTILGDLQALGMQIAIDDFGTGYSSLARERELNVNCLKIDKRFIDKLMHLEPEQAITGDIISMAHKLGHCVVAEGVEHESQRQYLKAHGCDKIQGYLVSRPLDPDAALELLSTEARMG
ncbi:MAG: EAL domain-containing protein [Clostridiales bacterium]|nr:EAL domain-containing protein [Clostridiales bacterium]